MSVSNALERDIHKQLDQFYCTGTHVDESETSFTLSSTQALIPSAISEYGAFGIQTQECQTIGYQFKRQIPTKVNTGLILKRTREFTMLEPIMALEQIGSDRFLVGTGSCSVVEFDTDLCKVSIVRQLHTNRISVLHSICTKGAHKPTHFLSGSDDHLIKLTSRERSMAIETFVGSSTGITSLSYDPTNNIFISANRSGQVHMWSQKVQRPLCLYSCNNAGDTLPATFAQFTPDPEYFVAASGTFLSLWDLRYNNRPVVNTNLLPSYAESLVLLGYRNGTDKYLEIPDNGNTKHFTSCDCAVLTSRGLFRVTLGDNPRILQNIDELSTSKICNILSFSPVIRKSELLESTPCLLITNRKVQKESIDADESILPFTIISQSEYHQRLNYVCKRPHRLGQAAYTTYLKSTPLEPESQGLILTSSDSTTLHLYRISIQNDKK